MTNNLLKIKAVKSKCKCNPSTITTWSDGNPIYFVFMECLTVFLKTLSSLGVFSQF